MIVIGLTGSIGMGKSTAAKLLEQMGCAIFDSDACVRQALSDKGEAFEPVALLFPSAWDKKTHQIKKDVLADIVFKDKDERKKLEAVLHPIVQHKQKEFIKAQTRLGKSIAVLDIPLLFETGAEQRVDYTIVVTAPFFIQRQRVLSRPAMSKEKFNHILASQMSDGEKRKRADFIVSTSLGLAYTRKQLKKILESVSEGPCNLPQK